MKGIKRVISAVIAVCMIAVMLPAQIALATAEGNIDDYIKGRTSSIANVPENYAGHIWEYEDYSSDDTKPYDYKLTVYARNMTVSRFQTALSYDPADVQLVSYGSGYEYNDEDFGGDLTVDVDSNDTFFEYGTVTSDMVSSSASSLVGESLNTAGLFEQATSAYSQIVLNESEYCQLFKLFSVSNITAAFTQKKWINSGTGAKYEASKSPSGEEAIGYMYTLPSNKNIKLFSVFFKKVGDVDADTFKPYYNTVNKFHGGVGITTNQDKSQNFLNEGVYLVSFPVKEAAPVSVSVNVTNNSGTALSGATVSLYTDAECTEANKVGTGTTDGSGKATIANVTANSSYYYKVEMSGYTTQSGLGPITVAEANVDVTEAVKLLQPSEIEYNLTITVVNGDDPTRKVGGAEVTIGGVSAGTADSNGALKIQKPNGTYSITAAKSDGSYTANTAESVTVNGADAAATVKTIPKRASVTLPQVKDKDGQTVDNAKYTIILKDGKADAWGTSQTFDAGSAATVPVGCEFEVVLSSPADYSTDKLYLKSGDTANDTPKIFTDSGMQNEFSGNVEANRIGDPYYNVVIDKGTDAGTYTAKVTLNNINAMNGTFGLRYDKNVFELAETNGFTYNSDEIEPYETDTTGLGVESLKVNAITQSTDSDTIGYHVFTWQGKSDENGVSQPFDATSGKDFATYTFKLKDTKTEEDITSDAFSVMPYDKTAEAKAFIDRYQYGLDAGAREFLDTFFRYTDEENDETNPALGRLEASKALEGGFYQSVENLAVGGDTAGLSVDVMTKIENNLTAKSAVLKFEVVDENGGPVENAKITVSGGNLTGAVDLTTDGTGIAKMNVDTSAGDQTYTYIIDCPGYWDMESSKTVTVIKTEPPKTTSVKEVLETKIYHEPKLVSSADGTTAINNAKLGGNAYAYGYKKHDFYFSITPDPGYQYTAPTPNEIDVVLKDENGNDKDYKAQFDAAENMYKIPGSEILGKKNDNPVSTTDPINPNENGFKSFDIIIKIDQNLITESDETYNIKAMAGTHGKVAYTADTTDSDTSGTVDGTPTDSEVKIKEVEPAKNVGKFTFTAVDDGDTVYKVEKVYINGVQVHDYDNMPSFDYTFKNVIEDSSIAVTFWDGVTPSTDSVITLVAGDKGTVNITAPAGEDPVRNDTKMYLFSGAGTLTFEPVADTPDYEFNKVEQSVNGGAKTEVTENSGSYTVTSAAGGNTTAYVTFKAKGAKDTFTVIVKSYVEAGEGTIAPIGILAYNKNDSPIFTLTATGDDSRATGVKINGVEESLGGQYQETTYQLMNIQSDTEIGAIFSETAYVLHGIVDLAQGAASALGGKPTSGATITCVRANDPENMTVIKTSDALRTGATFTAELAKGTWTITVSKKGYLNYTITDYVVDGTKADMYLGDDDATDAATAKIIPIVPVIGNTSGTGLTVSLLDAGLVGSALRPGITPTAKLKADVDNDEAVKATSDMVYIKQNYGRRNITETYAQFKANHAITTP